MLKNYNLKFLNAKKNHTVGQVIEGEVTLWAFFPEIILILIVQREFDLFSVADNSKSHSCLLLKNLVWFAVCLHVFFTVFDSKEWI